MVKNLPDKWIRKAVYDAINDIVVDNETIPCYDSKVTGNPQEKYTILSTQTNGVNKSNKCEYQWESSILVEVIVRERLTSNAGSRLSADNIMNSVKSQTNNLNLDILSNLEIVSQIQSFPNDIVEDTSSDIVYRKLMRIEFLIN